MAEKIGQDQDVKDLTSHVKQFGLYTAEDRDSSKACKQCKSDQMFLIAYF